MGTTSLSHQTHLRRKRITALVAATFVVALVIVGFTYWRGVTHEEKPLPTPQPLPKNVDQQLSGYTFSRSEGDRRVFTVHAARTISFTQGGSTVLQDVWVEIFGPAGNRHDILRTEQCEYNPNSGELFAAGAVTIELNNLAQADSAAGRTPSLGHDPLQIETSKVHFTQQATMAETDQPVKFKSERASGTAVGMIYSTKTGSVELQKDVVLDLPARTGPAPSPPAQLTASRLRYDKEKQIVDLWGPIEMTQADRRVTAGRGTIFLEGRNRIRQAVLEEGVHGVDKTPPRAVGFTAHDIRADFDPANGQLRTLHAEGNVEGEVWRNDKVSRLTSQVLDMAFSGIHPQPLDGTASGNVKLSIQPAKGANTSPGSLSSLQSQSQELTAAQIRFSFRPGQQSLRAAQTVGTGHIVLAPADPQAGAREIFGEPLEMEFDGHSRLVSLRGLSRAKLIFHPSRLAPPASSNRESTSDKLHATFNPATGELVAADQNGHYQFLEGDRSATADHAQYNSQSQVVTLTGNPQVWDPETRVHADRILLDESQNNAEGVGHVQSTHLNVGAAGQGTAKPVPTNVVADRMVARQASQFVHYEGHVRLWHGEDVMESPALDVYRTERRVTTASRVLTSFIQAPPSNSPESGPKKVPKAGPKPVTIAADRLDFSEDGRKGSYRGNVVLKTENTTLRADRLDVYFTSAATAESSEVDHAVADGHVTVVQPTRRTAGDHAEYFAAPGKILMTGGPPAVYDAVNGFTTGRSLTLFLHDDTIFVDGGDKSPTLSKHRISP